MTTTALQAAAEKVRNTLIEGGFEAYFVGGCVRDMFLGRPPKDYDLVTNATPEQIAPLFEEAKLVGAQFGVVIVKVDDFQFEIATYRKDGKYTDGRRPDSVEFASTIQEDLDRRDFTMNGLVSVSTVYLVGSIRDWVGGRYDLRDRLVRTIGNPVDRFSEDALRLLRAVRFAVQLGFNIEPKTWTAIQNNADGVLQVSRERVRDELIKILVSPDPARGIFLLIASGLDRYVLPELRGANLTRLLHLLATVPQTAYRSAEFLLGTLCSCFHLDSLATTIEGLKLSNEQRDIIYEMANWSDFAHFQLNGSSKKSWMKRRLRRPHAQHGLNLYYLHCLAEEVPRQGNVTQTVETLRAEGLSPKQILPSEELMLRGFKRDALGMIIRELETEQLDGKISTPDEARSFLEKAYA
jgi:tRNA nucleotidyltransferase/poly(A) polymerase